MKISVLKLTVVAFLPAMTFVCGARIADEPEVTLEPFEPSYKAGDKFSRPKEVVAPRFLWPFEMRRGAISGEVVVLVELDGHGKAKRLATLYTTHPLFAISAIEALKKAQWDSADTDWFYYKVVFDVTEEEPNQPPQRNAGSRPSSSASPASETPSSLGPRG